MRCLWGFLQISSRPRRILGANVFAAMGARLADASRAFGRPHPGRRDDSPIYGFCLMLGLTEVSLRPVGSRLVLGKLLQRSGAP